MMERIYPFNLEEEKSNSFDSSEEIKINNANKDFKSDNLAEDIKKAISSMLISPIPSSYNFKKIRNEFKIFEATGKRTENLEVLFQALLTIQPTSTSNERVFSVAGNFSTKIRNQLQFSTLNCLIFLKYYFLKLQ